jgi:hypothetical protein
MRTRLSIALVSVLLVAADGGVADLGEVQAEYPGRSEWELVRGWEDGVPLKWASVEFKERGWGSGLAVLVWVVNLQPDDRRLGTALLYCEGNVLGTRPDSKMQGTFRLLDSHLEVQLTSNPQPRTALPPRELQLILKRVR